MEKYIYNIFMYVCIYVYIRNVMNNIYLMWLPQFMISFISARKTWNMKYVI